MTLPCFLIKEVKELVSYVKFSVFVISNKATKHDSMKQISIVSKI